jgi:integrase
VPLERPLSPSGDRPARYEQASAHRAAAGPSAGPHAALVRQEIIANHFVEWQGAGVKSVKNGFARAVEVAKLDLSDGNVTPHTLRHTAATWLMQLGTDPWEAAGYLGMSVKILIDTYGHHHPDYMKEASGAITRKRETTKRVVGTSQTTKPAVRTRSIRAI